MTHFFPNDLEDFRVDEVTLFIACVTTLLKTPGESGRGVKRETQNSDQAMNYARVWP